MRNVKISFEVEAFNCVAKVRADSARRGRGVDEVLSRALKEIKEEGGWPSDKGEKGANTPSKPQ